MIYQIVFNNQGQWKDEDIHNTVIKINTVTAWWHYIPNTYLLKTTSTSKQIADYLLGKFPGLLFFISKVDLSDVNGVLVKNAWDWIEKEKGIKLKLVNKPVVPNYGLLSSIGLLPNIPQTKVPDGVLINSILNKAFFKK